MDEDHSKYHSANAFCGFAGPEEMQHLVDLIDQLTDSELKQLVQNIGITFGVSDEKLEREDYEGVIDEADREDFYREYRKLKPPKKINNPDV